MKIFQYGGRHRAVGTMWLTMWPVTWPTEANENMRVARGTLSAITVGSSNLCTGPKFRAAAPNIVADQNFSVVLDLLNLRITFHITGQLQPQSSSVEVVPDNNVSLSTKILKKTMKYRLHWRHINTCCRVMCAYNAYVTIRRTLGGTCFESCHFVNN